MGEEEYMTTAKRPTDLMPLLKIQPFQRKNNLLFSLFTYSTFLVEYDCPQIRIHSLRNNFLSICLLITSSSKLVKVSFLMFRISQLLSKLTLVDTLTANA